MSEMIDLAYDSAKEDMQKAMDRLDTELRKIRAGKAHPSMLDSVKVDYYGALTPLNQVGNVSTTDPRTLTVQAYEKSMLDPIAMAITNANLGLNPMNNGEVPIVSRARAHRGASATAKQAKAVGENAKVSIGMHGRTPTTRSRRPRTTGPVRTQSRPERPTSRR